jgi:hypothetical protein
MNDIEHRGNNDLETPALTAADVIACVVDWFSLKNIPISSRWKGMIGRQAKELLADGFDFDTVVAASILAIRRGGPHLVHYIAGDLVAAKAGEWIPTRDVYRKKLEDEIEIRRAEVDKMIQKYER